jgi:hypothetical protein
MSALFEELATKARQLSSNEIRALIDRIIGLLPDDEEVTDEPMLELARQRLREMDAGSVSPGTHEEMMGRLRAKLGCSQ